MACRKPSFEQSTTRPCRSALGAKAMEWMTKSSWPHSASMRLNTASNSPGCFDIERQQQAGLDLLGQRLDKAFRFFIEIGEGQFGAEGAQLDGAAIGDGIGIGDADDEAALALEHVANPGVGVPNLGERIDLQSLFVHEFSP